MSKDVYALGDAEMFPGHLMVGIGQAKGRNKITGKRNLRTLSRVAPTVTVRFAFARPQGIGILTAWLRDSSVAKRDMSTMTLPIVTTLPSRLPFSGACILNVYSCDSGGGDQNKSDLFVWRHGTKDTKDRHALFALRGKRLSRRALFAQPHACDDAKDSFRISAVLHNNKASRCLLTFSAKLFCASLVSVAIWHSSSTHFASPACVAAAPVVACLGRMRHYSRTAICKIAATRRSRAHNVHAHLSRPARAWSSGSWRPWAAPTRCGMMWSAEAGPPPSQPQRQTEI